MTSTEMTEKDFEPFQDFAYNTLGIYLPKNKIPMLSARLNKLMNNAGTDSYSEYLEFVLRDDSGKALADLVDRITTNHTFFFREAAHFNYLDSVVLPELCINKCEPTIRIWSAGCSTGEEVYSLAMCAEEFKTRNTTNSEIRILGTDISNTVITKAGAASYSEERLVELSEQERRRYFEKDDTGNYRVKATYANNVAFRKLNLNREKFPFSFQFDIVFCRNVMIYFDGYSRERLLANIFNVLKPGGYLFIGHSETIPRHQTPFQYQQPAVYRRPLK